MATAVTATSFYTPEQIAQLQQTIPPPDYQLGKGGEGLEGTIAVAQAYTIQGGQVAVAAPLRAGTATASGDMQLGPQLQNATAAPMSRGGSKKPWRQPQV